ncbi:hypothetical protein [Pseudobacteriovorax antillogorgiicola]|uniref:Uncharacterized protein n=1 Tax=Pseudobacteriovorax antillogorgiicola TaxID=1513793 RepID=A0A1Y6CG59_9BACT|nr:hypothetical protein [Pseudobacteriovorax antillogorgiicola]TCS47604.1 hypothetical protein EDD56_12045 [Pseudobacteriovorax antillogorgiicola]SMF60122.1 hypothetical protein SAMN06296036_12095 [Pseudobacteriovorax antillogorgiicola]
MFFRIIFIWFITGWSSLAQGNLAAKQGVIDLTEWDLLSKPVLTLKGEYGFYWARDDDETSISDRLDYRVIPNTWDQSLAPSTQPKNGVPTFRLHVLLPDVSSEIGIVFREIAIVHKVLIGGQPVFSLGPPGVIPDIHRSSIS